MCQRCIADEELESKGCVFVSDCGVYFSLSGECVCFFTCIQWEYVCVFMKSLPFISCVRASFKMV